MTTIFSHLVEFRNIFCNIYKLYLLGYFVLQFRLVFSMCCGYVVGTLIYSLSAAKPLMTTLVGTQATGIGGLLVFGLCAGLMKAVYSSMGPDQFVLPEQRTLQQRYLYKYSDIYIYILFELSISYT